jgi:hypothetical protein
MGRMHGRVRGWGRIGWALGGRRRVGGGIGVVGKREVGVEVGSKLVLLRRRRGSGVGSGGVVVRRRWVPEQGQKLARRRLCGRCGRSAGRCGLRLLGGLVRCVELAEALLSLDSCRQARSGFGGGDSPV